jgi:hypothetical protein
VARREELLEQIAVRGVQFDRVIACAVEPNGAGQELFLNLSDIVLGQCADFIARRRIFPGEGPTGSMPRTERRSSMPR